MKFSVSIPDEILAIIDRSASDDGVTRTEWIRQVVTRACTHNEETEPESPRVEPPENPDRTFENPERTLQITNLDAEVRRLEGLIEEKDQRIADLKAISDRLLDQGERYQVLLQQHQQNLVQAGTTPAEPSTPRETPWWNFWKNR